MAGRPAAAARTIALRHIGDLYPDAQQHALRDAYLVVGRGVVREIGVEPWDGQADVEIDLRGCLVLPGLVSLHDHFLQAYVRASHHTVGDRPAWLAELYTMLAHMTVDDVATAARHRLAEVALGGVTTAVDHAFVWPGSMGDGLEAELHVIRGQDVRVELVVGWSERLEDGIDPLARRLGPERFGHLLDESGPALALTRAVLARDHDASPGARLRIGIGPSSLAYTAPDVLVAMREAALEHEAVLCTHFHPRADEHARTRADGRGDMYEALEASGWLEQPSLYVHATRIPQERRGLFARQQVGLALCTRAALRLGHPLPPMAAMQARQVQTGLGLDGAASNDGGAMLDEMGAALLALQLQGDAGAPPDGGRVSARDVLHAATAGGAALVGRPELGRLAVGAPADVAAFRVDGLPHVSAAGDALTAVLLSTPKPRAELTMVGGTFVVRDGALTGVDERTLVEASRAAAERLAGSARAAGHWPT